MTLEVDIWAARGGRTAEVEEPFLGLDTGKDTHGTHTDDQADRPIIYVRRGAVHEAVDAAINVLRSPAAGVYQRGDHIVRPVVHKHRGETLSVRQKTTEGNGSGTDGAVSIARLESDALTETLTRHANFQKFDGRAKDWVDTDCPPDVARMVIARRGHGWKLRPLRAVIQSLTLRPDGSVIAEPGYDPDSGLLLVTDRQWPAVASAPTKAAALAALETLREPIAGFPFVGGEDEAAALALLITAVARPSLRTSPMFAVTAPAAGSGKSKLIDLAAVLATGRTAAVVTPTPDEAELEKRIGTAALAGDSVITIDNISSILRSDMLCQLLTQNETQVRILGRSEGVKIPNTALICATGNNLALFGDLNRRAVRIRLDAGVERPDEREFDFDPVRFSKRRRGELVAAALTILRAYLSAGSPSPASAMGSFEDWSDLVRSALLWLGTADPRGDIEEMRAEDPEKVALSEVLGVLPMFDFQVRDVKGLFDSDADARAALARFSDRGGHFNTVKFAGFLRRYKGTPVGGRKIALARADEKRGSTWRVEYT